MNALRLVLDCKKAKGRLMSYRGLKTNLLICLGIFSILAAAPAFANGKGAVFGWWPGHDEWTSYKKFNPYLEKGKDTQNQQWGAEDWYVQDWLSQNEDNIGLIDGFFRTDILREQTSEDDVPVLIVGPQFYRLGGFDKRRVVTTLDTVYGITEKATHPIIVLKDWHTKREIGLFSKDGLQLE
jgi:hypothetical protein